MNKYLIAALAAAVLSLGWAADHYHDKAVSWRATAHQAQTAVNRLGATITNMQQRQEQLAVLDKTHTEALNAAESENDDLRRQLAAGSRRMYVHAKCPVSGADYTAESGRLGNGSTVELAADARQNILDIRAGIIRDREKLSYLQEFVRKQCLK